MKDSSCQSLLAWSGDTNFSNCSSYSALANYLPQTEKVTALRKRPTGIDQRLLNRIVSKYAISNWYQLSSISVEKLVWDKMKSNTVNLVHFLWAERDLGYIDWLYRKSHLPICCTFHTCADTLPQVIQKKNFIKKLSAVILMSETQRPFLEDCGLDSSKIHFIPHGVDTEFFKPARINSKNEKFTVLSVGSYRRNFSLMRTVIKKLEDHSNIMFKVVSSPNNLKYFYDLNNVEFLSKLSIEDLIATYQTSSCLFLSVENATANNALLEAMACGLPIISENVGGISEYVNKSVSKLSNPGEACSIAASIVELSKNPKLCMEMSSKARALSLHFSWSKIAKITQELYQDISCDFR